MAPDETVKSPALEVRNLSVVYGKRTALSNADLSVPAGAMLGVVGPNGGGKSTLIKGILGIVRAQGEVLVGGRPLDRKSRGRIGYVPQRDDVDWKFPVSAFDVVMMGRVPTLGLLRRPSAGDRSLVHEALESVGMAEHAGKQIGEFSGGQQQRVFLARALAQGADVLLLDEPVSGVDAPSQHEIFDLLHKLQGEGKTIIVSTHDLSCVAERFDLALLLNRKVVAFGEPDSVFTPELLNETYESHLMLLKVGDRMVAVEDTGRHGVD